jgi:enoyl-CoA hydratase/carnithine racemase
MTMPQLLPSEYQETFLLAQGGPPNEPLQPASNRSTLIIEKMDGGIVLIGIDRPEAKNRLDPPTLLALGKALYAAEHDDDVRVSVLHGKEPDFRPGVDPELFAAAVRAGQIPPKDPDFINAFGLRPPLRTKPLVVAVQGITRYGGHELFLAADIRVAASDTVFSQGEVANGIFPAAGGTVRFPREVGWGNALLHVLNADTWCAAEAYRLGLVQEVTPPGQQLDRAIEIARKIAKADPLGVRATIASARESVAHEDAAMGALTPVFAKLLQSEDRREALRAAKENRPANYQGRAPAFNHIRQGEETQCSSQS